LETTYKYFVSFHPRYRRKLIRLAAMANEELHAMVEELNHEILVEQIQLRYSDALATADLSRSELLHPVDGWHASIEGHNAMAQAACRDLKTSLEFLGIQLPSDQRGWLWMKSGPARPIAPSHYRSPRSLNRAIVSRIIR
jgi:hypothetical protein